MISNSEPFTCIQCGECCKGYGGTYVSAPEIFAIARYLGISEAQCLRQYCTLSGQRAILAQGSDGYCIFFKHNCSIHPVKPRMCRNWPYIESLLVDIGNWHIMADSCPGMRQDMDDRSLRETVKQKLAARLREPRTASADESPNRPGPR
jgi:uncharacterized protein